MKINPFKRATSVPEFFALLRKDLERLRGKKFRYCKTSEVFIDRSLRLHFCLDADRTGDASWADLAENRGWARRPRPKWDGYGMFEFSCGGSGAKSFSSRYFATIELKYLPGIVETLKRLSKIAESRSAACGKDAEYVRLHAAFVVKQEEAAAIREARDVRAAAVLAAFDRKNPPFDIIIGKCQSVRRSPHESRWTDNRG